MKRELLSAAIAVSAAVLAGCAVAPAPIYDESFYDDSFYDEPVYVAPPPPRVEYPGYAPVVGYVWIGGSWAWTGYRYDWRPGRWEPPRPGYRWAAPRWDRHGNAWRHAPGRWEPEHGPVGRPPEIGRAHV